jgi:hypothetical protein
MPVFFVRSIGANLALIEPVGAVDPGFGGGWGGGMVDPGYGIGAGLRPGHDLPGGGAHPWFPGHVGGPRPDHGLPGSPGHPDNRPPSGPPVQVGPGEVLVMIRDQAGVWHYAALAPGTVPPKPVPPASGSGNHPSGQPVPPPGTAVPKA